MIICGLKLTHDAAVALLDDDKLIFSVELEKYANNKRYISMSDLSIVEVILSDFGYKITDVDSWIIDGWDGTESSSISLHNYEVPISIQVAPYHEGDTKDFTISKLEGQFYIGNHKLKYKSYPHVLGHILSSYCTSPFSKNLQESLVLIWDGGMFPRLYSISPKKATIECLGYFLIIIGHFYATAAHHFGPFKRETNSATADDLSVAGKLMAYIALGSANQKIINIIEKKYKHYFDQYGSNAIHYLSEVGGWGTSVEPSVPYLHTFFDDLKETLKRFDFTDEDILASIHEFLEKLIVSSLANFLKKNVGEGPWNLCLAGGCALNIKWNSAFRAHPLFKDVWVPPFPNDSGSAIGAASCEIFMNMKIVSLDWNARLGLNIKKPSSLPDGWNAEKCSTLELAKILHYSGKPVVVLNGRSELGPRALGNRSILASPCSSQMKGVLNDLKKREYYRPVAPICLANIAPQIFDPGTPDPYMLFDHYVRDEWLEKIPAVVHLDKTARLQTVSQVDDAVLESILREYYKLSGIPVLCNTSANFNGSGFFPNVESAMEWGKIDMIWCDGELFKFKGI